MFAEESPDASVVVSFVDAEIVKGRRKMSKFSWLSSIWPFFPQKLVF